MNSNAVVDVVFFWSSSPPLNWIWVYYTRRLVGCQCDCSL